MHRVGNMINKAAATKLFDDNFCLIGDRAVTYLNVKR